MGAPLNQPAAPLPDRGHLLTEQRNPRSMDLDTLSVAGCVRAMQQEDASVAEAVSRASEEICAFVSAIESRMREAAGDGSMGRLVYLGAGTSGRLGVLDASECPPTFCTPPELIVGVIAGGDRSLRVSSEGREDEYDGARDELDRLRINASDTLLGIAAGGTTPYVLGALEEGARRGALAGWLTCASVQKPAFVEHHIVVETGPEIVTGSTRLKAGTATKLVLNTITTTLMVRMGKVYENLMVDLRASNAKLRDRAARIICTLTGLDREAALDLLDRAGGECKTAIVMHERAASADHARAFLAEHDGRLRDALA